MPRSGRRLQRDADNIEVRGRFVGQNFLGSVARRDSTRTWAFESLVVVLNTSAIIFLKFMKLFAQAKPSECSSL